MTEKKTILYVDDEIINTEVFKYSFIFNYNIIIALSAEEGLKIIEENPNISFVISDLKMPKMTGLEFIYEIKKTKQNLPCMILSGYEENSTIQEAIKKRVIVDYMMKPFNKQKIEALINEHAS